MTKREKNDWEKEKNSESQEENRALTDRIVRSRKNDISKSTKLKHVTDFNIKSMLPKN